MITIVIILLFGKENVLQTLTEWVLARGLGLSGCWQGARSSHDDSSGIFLYMFFFGSPTSNSKPPESPYTPWSFRVLSMVHHHIITCMSICKSVPESSYSNIFQEVHLNSSHPTTECNGYQRPGAPERGAVYGGQGSETSFVLSGSELLCWTSL